MTEQDKERIAQMLRDQLGAKGEGQKALSQRSWGSPHDISVATISNTLTGKWELIADKMWRRIAAAVGYHAREWHLANTRDHVLMTQLLDRVRDESITMALSYKPASGKTATLTHYAATHPNVVYLPCADHWSKRHFLRQLYRGLGHDPAELTVVDLADSIVSVLRRAKKPVVILDELDKLNERTLLYLIDLYNHLDGICGFFYAGSEHLQLKMDRGCVRDKRGYRELFSRMGSRFLRLNGINRKDAALICTTNGMTDEADVQATWNEVSESKDIRRIKRLVETHRQAREKKQAA